LSKKPFIKASLKFSGIFLKETPNSVLFGTIEYFDICSGSNYSDPEYLEYWGGKGGYFANIANGGYKNRQQFSYREIKEIERSDVDINDFLKFK
jgi:hypothetical protein